jgi:hypothetical protein
VLVGDQYAWLDSSGNDLGLAQGLDGVSANVMQDAGERRHRRKGGRTEESELTW